MAGSPVGPVLDDGTHRRVLQALLVCQRHSWDQGLTAAVLDGAGEAALAQLAGHRARLRRSDGLWCARWDEDAGAPADGRAWGTGNGWVAAALARTVARLPGGVLAAEARAHLDACAPRRRPGSTAPGTRRRRRPGRCSPTLRRGRPPRRPPRPRSPRRG